MLSDSIIWHPIQYKLLFGNYAKPELRCKFAVVKGDTPISDNELKQYVIKYINGDKENATGYSYYMDGYSLIGKTVVSKTIVLCSSRSRCAINIFIRFYIIYLSID